MQNKIQYLTPKTLPSVEPAPEQSQQSAYTIIVGLIQNLDTHIMAAQRFHLTALGCLIPLISFFVLEQADWRLFVSLGFLAVAVVAHWASTTTKLTLQKLCWTRHLRELEAQLFPTGDGPFTVQKAFFDDLSSQDVGSLDRLLIQDVGSKRSQFIPIIALFVAVLSAVLITLARYQ